MDLGIDHTNDAPLQLPEDENVLHYFECFCGSLIRVGTKQQLMSHLRSKKHINHTIKVQYSQMLEKLEEVKASNTHAVLDAISAHTQPPPTYTAGIVPCGTEDQNE